MNQVVSFFLFLSFFSNTLFAQYTQSLPEFVIEETEMEAHLRFLASDELQGRATGTEGNNTAARYIAEQFRAYGVQTAPNLESYFQPIHFQKKQPPYRGKLIWGEHEYFHGKDLVLLSGEAMEATTEAVFAGYGWVDLAKDYNDYKDLDVDGKIVFVLSGMPEGENPFEAFEVMNEKRAWAAERGAIALIELFRMQFPWYYFKSYFNKERLEMVQGAPDTEANTITYGWIKENSKEALPKLKTSKGMEVTLENSGVPQQTVVSNNVIGIVEGSDPNLREEYILLSAHYDHVGAGENTDGRTTVEDTIFNGARDNGMGVVALLAAAKSLAKSPPKRSIIFLAVTAEEIGLLGSAYYADNPILPLEQTIFNLNTDGAGYEDTKLVSVIGYGRTGTDDELEAGAAAFDLKVFPNPAPEQGLYDRSDNVSFAKKGVPAAAFSPGVTGFTDEVRKYYHKVNDEVDSIDFAYLLKFCQAFTHTARFIADKSERPFWRRGDKYEAAGKALYQENK